MDRFVAAGGTCATSIEECVTDASVLLLMVVNAKQAADVLFEGGAAKGMSTTRTCFHTT
jgi:3-hydroxyisobutyrate dehydrogenase-like beta-hydroxyacid dehydrogenase